MAKISAQQRPRDAGSPHGVAHLWRTTPPVGRFRRTFVAAMVVQAANFLRSRASIRLARLLQSHRHALAMQKDVRS
ncbi:hypothetical protein [Sphingomonas jatrophae]|uniref:hypothetical protein n=1 Tax=Sphingomonas jatrophae TaxID=1166337 RepID=UPI0010426F1C|nr:hypothetical protein [Sphingomonas jatrophae]